MLFIAKLKTNQVSLNSSLDFVYHGTGHDEVHVACL